MLVDGFKKILIVDKNNMRQIKALNVAEMFKTSLVIGNTIYVGCKTRFCSFSLPDYKPKDDLVVDYCVR